MHAKYPKGKSAASRAKKRDVSQRLSSPYELPDASRGRPGGVSMEQRARNEYGAVPASTGENTRRHRIVRGVGLSTGNLGLQGVIRIPRG